MTSNRTLMNLVSDWSDPRGESLPNGIAVRNELLRKKIEKIAPRKTRVTTHLYADGKRIVSTEVIE